MIAIATGNSALDRQISLKLKKAGLKAKIVKLKDDFLTETFDTAIITKNLEGELGIEQLLYYLKENQCRVIYLLELSNTTEIFMCFKYDIYDIVIGPTIEKILDAINTEKSLSDWSKFLNSEIGINMEQQLHELQEIRERERKRFEDEIKNLKRRLEEEQNKEPVIVEKKVEVPVEIPVTVEKIIGTVVIAVAGTINRIGTTHAALSIAEFLKDDNNRVAIIEYHKSKHFQEILNSYEDALEHEDYFSLDNMYFYPYSEDLSVLDVLQEDFNYIVLDMGKYAECDISEFKRSSIRIIVSGVKDWEVKDLELILRNNDKEYLKNIKYYFNFSDDESFERIKSSMIDEETGQFNCYKAEFNFDPFVQSEESINVFKDLFKDILLGVNTRNINRNKKTFSPFKIMIEKLNKKIGNGE